MRFRPTPTAFYESIHRPAALASVRPAYPKGPPPGVIQRSEYEPYVQFLRKHRLLGKFGVCSCGEWITDHGAYLTHVLNAFRAGPGASKPVNRPCPTCDGTGRLTDG